MARQLTELERRYPSFPTLIENFHGTLHALRELVRVVGPHLEEHDRSRLPHDAQAAVDRLPAAKREELLSFFGEFLEPSAIATVDHRTSGPEDPPEDEQDAEGGRTLNLREIFGEDEDGLVAFSSGFERAVSRPPSWFILNGSLLTNAVGILEVLVGGVLSQHYLLHPGALGAHEKEFSLDDLAGFDSIDDARMKLIDARVEARMRESFDDWDSWFSRNLNIAFDDFAIDSGALAEIFQRRHIIVHSAGRVSRKYLDKVRLDEAPAMGTLLPVTPAYLEVALDEIQAFGLLLAIETWQEWLPDERDAAVSFALEKVFELMVLGRWRVVDRVASRIASYGNEGFAAVAMRCNAWCARKRLDRFEECRSEVESWNTSALVPVFALVRSVLLDALDTAFELLPRLLESGELSAAHALTWPILSELRDDERFPPVIAASNPAT